MPPPENLAYLTDICIAQRKRTAYLLHLTLPTYCPSPIYFICLI